MNRNRRKNATILTTLLLTLSLNAGCEWDFLRLIGPNISIGINIPLGLNGNPGLLNPFGITQALVNTLLGLNQAATGQTLSANSVNLLSSPPAPPSIVTVR